MMTSSYHTTENKDMTKNSVPTYIPTSKHPIRFDRLRPGSYYQIVAEPSRGIRRSKDSRVYWKSTGGFFSVHPVTGAGVVLYPQDLVLPMKLVDAQRSSQ